jgi:hypothetical protein
LFYGTYLVAPLKCGHIHMPSNYWLIIALAALIPLVIGFIWYSKAVFGNSWMRVNRFHDDDMKGGNMILTFVLTYVFSFMIGIVLTSLVIHQFSFFSVVADDPTSEANKTWLANSIKEHGNKFRTFKHGALHGTIASIFFVLPVIGIISLFERRGWKYVIIHWGYWLVTLALMGGVICQFVEH